MSHFSSYVKCHMLFTHDIWKSMELLSFKHRTAKHSNLCIRKTSVSSTILMRGSVIYNSELFNRTILNVTGLFNPRLLPVLSYPFKFKVIKGVIIFDPQVSAK